ncbi:unnamed protein product [Bursaphelenchus okinawaensis]|uniref:Copper transport protein n=1 Tax=Bursaphelenchus okinawaensis TaxID=465554 RepID=A0A811K6E1_9BILA|nr:unnamed protein product [Bursaphelenchus okinawaensis]CAG9093851.1 unnamed protein product [Bursaphelenchus okinawaensis]
MAHNHHQHMEMSEQGHGMHGMNMHSMAFHFGSEETILFDFWKTSSPLGNLGFLYNVKLNLICLILSCLIVCFGCMAFEALGWLRLHRKNVRALVESQVPLIGRRKIDIGLIADTLIHGVQLLLGYCAMLVFMTFNVWLCLAVVFGIISAHLGFRIFVPQLDAVPNSVSEPCC